MSLKENSLPKLLKYMIITSLLLYAPFIFWKILLVYPDWGYDTYHSYVPQYELIVNKLTSGHFSLMDFTYGLGTNAFAFNMQSLLFDPFSIIPILFGLLFGAKNVAYSIVYMQMVKSIVAGIGCFYYLSEFSLSKKNIILASYLYAFSGYMIGAGQHYMFATAPVFLIFSLFFIEKSIKNKRYFMALAVNIALVCCFSAFFAFHIIAFCSLYALFRVLQISDGISFYSVAKRLSPFIFFMLLGLMLSGIIFFPSLYQIVEVSGRTTNDAPLFTKVITAFKFMSIADYKMSFLRFFSENMQGTVNKWNGGPPHFGAAHYFFSIALVLCVPQYIINSFSSAKNLKDKIIHSTIVCLVLFSVTNYFFGYFTNIFATQNWRYVYLLGPLFAIIIADTFDKIFIEKRFNRYVNIATVLLGVIAVAVNHDRESGTASKIIVVNTLACLIVSAFVLDYLITYKGNTPQVPKVAHILLCLVISFNIFVDHTMTIYAGRAFLKKDQILSIYHNKTIGEIVKYLNEKEKNNFYRLDKDFNFGTPDYVYSYMERYRSVSSYNSTLNKNSREFVKEMGNGALGIQSEQQAYYLGSFGEKFDKIMPDILGIKYLISLENINRDGWTLEKQFDNMFLYINNNINSAGLLYSTYILDSDYKNLHLLKKKLTPAECIILSEPVGNLTQVSDISYSSIENAIDFSNISFPNAWIDSITAAGEIIGSSWQGGAYDIPLNINNTYIGNQQNIFKFVINPNMTFDLNIIFDQGNGFQVNGFSQKIYENQDNLVALKIPSNTRAVRLVFAQASFRIFDMEIASKHIDYTSDGIAFENPNFGSVVSGNVRTDMDCLLYMPIPYEEGWKAFVDGIETKILQANYGFSAIELKQGIHNVEFRYFVPGLTLGALFSGISLITVVILGIFLLKSNRTAGNAGKIQRKQ